jgi:hypothetical protein
VYRTIAPLRAQMRGVPSAKIGSFSNRAMRSCITEPSNTKFARRSMRCRRTSTYRTKLSSSQTLGYRLIFDRYSHSLISLERVDGARSTRDRPKRASFTKRSAPSEISEQNRTRLDSRRSFIMSQLLPKVGRIQNDATWPPRSLGSFETWVTLLNDALDRSAQAVTFVYLLECCIYSSNRRS